MTSFYVDLDVGDLDVRLDGLYAALMADGEIFQALQVVERALATEVDSGRRQVWERRLAQRSDELRMFDSEWLPSRLLDGGPLTDRESGVVLGLFKSSLPESQAGYTIRTQRTLEAQQAAGYTVFPCTPLGLGGAEQVGSVRYRRLGSPNGMEKWSRTETLERNAATLLEVAREVRPELIHVASGFYGPDMGVVALAVAECLDVPLVYEIRGALAETWSYEGSGLKVQRQASWLRWGQELRLARAADAVVVICESLGDELERGGVEAAKMFVIPNGVDVEEFVPADSPALPESLSRMDSAWPTVGYISNLGPREGHLTLIEAVAILGDTGVDVNCVIVGDGPMMEDLESAVKARSVGDRVFLVGSVPHAVIRDYYSALDIFVIPREDDRAARYTTPLKPYEAMAMRIPMVASDLPALDEILGGEERGWSFYSGSPESLADVLTKVIGDPTETERRADAAYRWVHRERKWSDNASRYRKAFEYAVSSHSSRNRAGSSECD